MTTHPATTQGTDRSSVAGIEAMRSCVPAFSGGNASVNEPTTWAFLDAAMTFAGGNDRVGCAAQGEA